MTVGEFDLPNFKTLKHINKPTWIIIFVCLGLLLVSIPFLTHNHIYQSVALGGDTKIFIQFMNDATNGASVLELLDRAIYPGEALTLWGLGIINKVINVNSQDLFFAYSLLVLIMASVSLYFLGRFVGGNRTGWLVVIMGLLCTTSVLGLYSYACLVNIINVYIILIWAIILMGYWYIKRKIIYMIFGVGLIGLFSYLHPTAFYIPFMAVVLIVMLRILAWKKKIEKKEYYQYLGVIAIILGVNLGISLATQGDKLLEFWQLGSPAMASSILIGNSNVIQNYSTLGERLSSFFIQYLTPITMILGGLVIAGLYFARRTFNANKRLIYILVVLGSLAVVLIGGSIIGTVGLPERLMIDATTMLAVIIAVLFGKLIEDDKNNWLKISGYTVAGFGGVFALVGWVMN